MMLIVIFFVGSIGTAMLQRPVARLAMSIGAISRERDDRWQHNKPISRLAGLSFAVPVVMYTIIATHSALSTTLALIVLLGLVDDAIELSPFPKLAGQVIAIIPLVLVQHSPGYEIFVMLWLLIHINAANMFDNMDGSLAIVAALALVTYGAMLATSQPAMSAIAFTLAGGLVIFLHENWHPAKAFMGDTGSMVVGLVLGVCSLEVMSASNNVLKAMLPSSLILMDGARVCFARLVAHTPVWIGGLDHLSHSLARRGYRPERIAFCFAIITLFCSLAALKL